jgi:isoleucyl-tRNA synthetase
VNEALVRLLAPILSFTTEEVWSQIKKLPNSPESVHLSVFPQPEALTEGLGPEELERTRHWDRLMDIRESVLKNLEQARQEKIIGAPLEASVVLTADGDLYPLLQKYADQLPALFIVSQVAVASGAGLGVEVRRAEGTKCERCWKYTLDVGSSSDFPTVCAGCAEAVKEFLKG